MKEIMKASLIRQFLVAKTPNNWSTQEQFLGSGDRRYWVPKKKDLREILARVRVGPAGKQGEIFDCDEYACTLKSRLGFAGIKPELRRITGGHPIAAGIFWGKASWSPDPLHAGNWFVTRENSLVWIEPQFNNVPFQNAGNDPIRKHPNKVTGLRLMLF